MNYLAHLFLAADAPESILGSLMGDFVKGPVVPLLPRKDVESDVSGFLTSRAPFARNVVSEPASRALDATGYRAPEGSFTAIPSSTAGTTSNSSPNSAHKAAFNSTVAAHNGLCPTAIGWAIMEHRRVDTFTDSHPVVKASKARVASPYRRYAGILVDVFYDHFLVQQWSQFAAIPLGKFTAERYAILERFVDLLPAKMHRLTRYMVTSDLLGSYAHTAGIENALKGIERRLKRPSNLALAIDLLDAHSLAFEQDFLDFFPELITFVDREAGANQGTNMTYGHRAITYY